MSDNGLRLRGRWWAAVDPSGLPLFALAPAARAALGAQHGATTRLRFLPGVMDVERRGDVLLEGVPSLPSLVEPRRARILRVERLGAEVVGSKTYLTRAESDRLANPKPVPGWEERWRAKYGTEPPVGGAV